MNSVYCLGLGLLLLACLAECQRLEYRAPASRALQEEDWRPVSPRQYTQEVQQYDSEEQDSAEDEEGFEDEQPEPYNDSYQVQWATTPRAAKKQSTRKGGLGIKVKGLKKLKKYLLPLLLAYKLKFILIIPILLGGLFLLFGSTTFAGFFFALFAVGLSLKKD